MTSVNIGLKDKQLLKWFNEIHAALREAEKQYSNALVIDLKRNLLKQKILSGQIFKRANSNLIAALQTVIEEIRVTSLDGKK